MVIGATGSGKTTLSRRISATIGVPAIELDSLFHQPNWTPTPPDEFRAKVFAALERGPDGWVTDGNYSVIRTAILPLADTIVWLRLPRRTSYWRMFRRTMQRAWRHEELWNGNRESFRQAFLSRDSLLLWGLTHWHAHHRHAQHDLDTTPHTAELIELRSPREVEAFVASLRDPDGE
jgi:adenylate kinase family enzyme